MRWIALVLFLCVAACSAQKPSTVRPPADEPYIIETAIDVPEAAGSAVIVNASRMGQVSEGIQASYRAERLPHAAIDLFVYPAGRMPEEDGLARGVNEFRQSIADAERLGIFKDAKMEQDRDFPSKREDDSPLAASKLKLRFEKNGAPLESRAWIAYKQNYWFKVRISASPELATELDEAGDEIAHDLFQQSQALSKGACGQVTITLPPKPTQDQFVEATLEAMHRLQHEGCVQDDYPELEPGKRRTLLPFPPDAWSASPRGD